MVKMHKPFPELKPKNHLPVLRQSFNRLWNQEIIRAQREQPQGVKQASPDAFDHIDQKHGRSQTQSKGLTR